MQAYLPFIKDLLAEWYLFTLNNALYAAALATAVWLLTAILYSIRIAAIKRGKVASEKADFEKLHIAQQQLQHTQEELAATTEQMEKSQCAAQDETQRALALEQLIYQRNQQIAGIIQTLATSFDLGERPLLASEDVKADPLWQQHDKVITQLIERLRTEQRAKVELQQTCQAETAKLAEKEALLKALQTTLDAHTNQLSKLEQALEQQKSILQQQDNAHQALSDSLKNLQPAAPLPVEPKPETFRAVNDWQQPIQAQESPAIEDTLIAQPQQDNQAVQIDEAPQTVAAAQYDEKPQAATTWQPEETQIDLVSTAEAAAPVLPDINLQPVAEEAPYASLDVEQQPVIPAKGSLGKIKNLFGKKQQPVKTEPQWTASKQDETLPSDTEQQPDEAPQKTPGKLKGFYSKFKSKNK